MGGRKKESTRNTHIAGFEPLVSPRDVLAESPISAAARETVTRGREAIREALAGRSERLVIIAGPCSIHDTASALEYAGRLAKLRARFEDRLIIVMRTYFEKPRTTVGWKGLINDPGCDESYDIGKGLHDARNLLREINDLGLPCATEFLDPIVPQYTADLVSWAAIGARTTESQTHRQMASGLSMPVGFKNSTDGSLQAAIDAMTAATHGQAFLGIDSDGRTSIVRTQGNQDVHIVLRGGGGKGNYSEAHIALTKARLKQAAASPRAIMVDCSHANSGKDYRRQPVVFRNVLGQIASGERQILGLMLESYLAEGNQMISGDLAYGQSITDACIGWEQSEELLLEGYERIGGGA